MSSPDRAELLDALLFSRTHITLFGDICFVALFLIAGIQQIMNFEETKQKMIDNFFGQEIAGFALVGANIVLLGGAFCSATPIPYIRKTGCFFLFYFIFFAKDKIAKLRKNKTKIKQVIFC